MTVDPLPSAPARRFSLASIALALTIFVGGAVCGASITIGIMEQRLEVNERTTALLPNRLGKRLARKLGLDNAQTRRVLRIFEEHIDSILAIRHDSTKRMRVQLEQLHKDMETVLTTEQNAHWLEMSVKSLERALPELVLDKEP